MLLQPVRSKVLRVARRGLERSVRKPWARTLAIRLKDEIDLAMFKPSDSGIYGSDYFGADRNPLDRMGLSGYERYDRDTSNANAAAYLIWRYLPVTKTLDVGCATGFVVEALSELGMAARGTDISHYAVEHPAQGAQDKLDWGDLMAGLPYKTAEFELVTCLETLEHMKPEMIRTVLSELRRVTGKYLVATIPSFGPNPSGPGGWFDIKVRPELLNEYVDKGPEYDGPVPYDDLYRDANGEPIEGHLTIASFRWWTEQFEKAGFIRCPAVELRMHPHLARFGLTKYWNLYVFRSVTVEEPSGDMHPAEVLEHWEHNFKLDRNIGLDEDWEAVDDAYRRNGLPAPQRPSVVEIDHDADADADSNA